MEDLHLSATKQTANGTPYVSFAKTEYWKWLEELADGEPLVITISNRRSLGQNALYHKWVSIIADEIGEDFVTTKAYLSYRFFGHTEKEIDGILIHVPASTSRTPKKEFTKIMEQISCWALQELNVTLPSNDFLIN